MWLFSLFLLDVRLGGLVCLVLAAGLGAGAYLAARMHWAWLTYSALVLTCLLAGLGLTLLIGGAQ